MSNDELDEKSNFQYEYEYGDILNPHKNPKTLYGFKAEKKRQFSTNKPSFIDESQDLPVTIPKLSDYKLLSPNSISLLFKLDIDDDTDKTRHLINNVGRGIITKLQVNMEGKEIDSIESYDIWTTYKDLWLTKSERNQRIQQGIDDNGVINKIRIKTKEKEANKDTYKLLTGDTKQNVVAKTFGNTFSIPLDHDILKHLPYYPKGIKQKLNFMLHFAPYKNVIKATNDTDVKYKITNIGLEFDAIKHVGLATTLDNRYDHGLSIPYDKVSLNTFVDFKKSDSSFPINVNIPVRSLKGIALFFKDTNFMKDFAYENEKFYNPHIKKISVTIEGDDNKLFSNGFQPRHAYEQALSYFGSSNSDMTIDDFLTNKYCVWLDFRSTTDPTLHGSGLKNLNTTHGINLIVERNTDTSNDTIRCYVFYVCDAQINIKNNQYQGRLF